MESAGVISDSEDEETGCEVWVRARRGVAAHAGGYCQVGVNASSYLQSLEDVYRQYKLGALLLLILSENHSTLDNITHDISSNDVAQRHLNLFSTCSKSVPAVTHMHG